jgi:hypothetical protein
MVFLFVVAFVNGHLLCTLTHSYTDRPAKPSLLKLALDCARQVSSMNLWLLFVIVSWISASGVDADRPQVRTGHEQLTLLHARKLNMQGVRGPSLHNIQLPKHIPYCCWVQA